jgi:uroporphyrinogen-III synthase
MRRLLLLRPEPGLSTSAERARTMGLEVLARPLFSVEPVAWDVPDAANYNALLLTSANAVRHGGVGLKLLKSLPVDAVGAATAALASDAGFRVKTIGDTDLSGLLKNLPGDRRLLHLAGEDHRDNFDPRIDRRIVYRSTEIANPELSDVSGLVAAVHSPRAARRLAELVSARGRTLIAAISAAAAEAVGLGWERVAVAERPDDPSLLALAAMLCHTSPPR